MVTILLYSLPKCHELSLSYYVYMILTNHSIINTSRNVFKYVRKMTQGAQNGGAGPPNGGQGTPMEAKGYQWRSHVTNKSLWRGPAGSHVTNLAATGRAVAPPNVITFLVFYQHKTIYVAFCKWYVFKASLVASKTMESSLSYNVCYDFQDPKHLPKTTRMYDKWPNIT